MNPQTKVKPQHTPTPWKVFENSQSYKIGVDYEKQDKFSTEVKTMELCEGCGKLIDMKQDQGDYVYYRKENDQVAHPFCNFCLEKNDYNEPETVGIDPETELKKMGYEKEVA